MAATSRTYVVNAPRPAVWEVLADFGALSSWAAYAGHSCMLEHGATPVGSSRRVQAGHITLVERITEFVPNNALAYDIEGLPSRLGRVSNRWTLTPAAGRTAVTLTTTVRIGKHLPARLAEHAVCRLISRHSGALLAGLAARVEGAA